MIHVSVATSQQMLKDIKEAIAVTLPGAAGEFTLLPRHSALLTTLRPGTVHIVDKENATHTLSISGGSAQIVSDRCVVLVINLAPL